MKTMLQLPVVAAFALAPVLCTPALSATPETPAATVAAEDDHPFAAVRDASSIELEYWDMNLANGDIREARVTVPEAQMKRLAEILSRLQPYSDFVGGAWVDFKDDVWIHVVVDGKADCITKGSISTEGRAHKYVTLYILDEADYAELMGILRALDPIGLFKDGDR